MRYVIDRVSESATWNSPKPPVPEAVMVEWIAPATGNLMRHWEIELSTLDELDAFVSRDDVGTIIYDPGHIQIYDGYAE